MPQGSTVDVTRARVPCPIGTHRWFFSSESPSPELFAYAYGQTGFRLQHQTWILLHNFSDQLPRMICFRRRRGVTPRDLIPPTNRSLSHDRSSVLWKRAALTTHHHDRPSRIIYARVHSCSIRSTACFSGLLRHAQK